MNNYEFGKFLAELRKEKGLTQIQLAEKLNITDKAISRWETGKNYPDIELFEKLSNALDVSISELLEGKRIEKEKLFTVSEEHIVNQIKKNKKSKKKYLIIISVILVFSFVFGYFALKETGYFDGVINTEIPCYSNDVLTILNNIYGYISQRPKSDGGFIIDDGYFFIDRNKKTPNDLFHLMGTFENGRTFYIRTIYNENNPNSNYCFIREYRESQIVSDGIPFEEFKTVISQLDISLLPYHETYQISIEGNNNYDDYNLNSNNFQKNIMKFVFLNGVLQKYNNSYISGEFAVIKIWGFNQSHGKPIAYIFYKK